MACDFLMKFLDSIKIDSRKLTPHSFEKICYCYSLKMLEESDSRYFDQMIQLLNLMQRRTGYPITFWNKVSLILALSNSDSDAAHKLYLELTDDGKNFHRLHHSLLYKIAIENEWPLPSFLQSVEEVPAESLHSMPQQEDLQEFDNDKTDMFEEEILLEADKEKFGIIQRKELDSETFSRLLQYLPHVDKPFNQLIQGQQLPAEVST